MSRLKTAGGLVRNNGLSITLAVLFLIFMGGQTLTGWYVFNEEQREHQQEEVGLVEYLRSGHFVEFQRGSAESKKPGEAEPVDRDPRMFKTKRDAPWPVRRGGWVLTIYQNSLSLAFVLLFLVSFALHAAGGAALNNEEAVSHGGELLSVGQFMRTSQFWFESFQNWQSEFLSLVAMVVLSIFLRQRGSPESKPVDAAHADTGSE
jgi:hypothetical protein